MSYKRLHSRIKGFQEKNFEEIVSAFEAEGQAFKATFTPPINHPQSDYTKEINNIAQVDAKLGLTFKRLNQHQRHAVFFPAQNAILSAMVGSGKTTVLIAKLFYLHFIKQVPFSQMVVLTFTNKAAREIKERIATFLGKANANMNEELRYFGTFHAVARQLLQEHPKLADMGFKPDFLIMDEQEKQTFLERIIVHKNLNIKYQNHLAKRWRNYSKNGQTVMGNMKLEDDFAALVELAEKEKRLGNTMDFDDLILLCNQLLKIQANTQPAWIIVDEFQDCNKEQLELIELLKAPSTQLFVVGDQNQSIYAWRGSNEHLFQEIQSQWNATWMELPQNYRSSKNIVSAAACLLADHNETLIATRHKGTPINLLRHFDDQQEAYYLREQLQLLIKENIPLNTVAILFRTHQQINSVETILSQAAIPHQFAKRTELHENPAQCFLLKILKVCINNNDMDACLSLICDATFGALKRSKKIINTLHKARKKGSVLRALIRYLEQLKKPHSQHITLLKNIELFENKFLQKDDTSAKQLLDFLELESILKPTSIHHREYRNAIIDAWSQVQRFVKDKGFGSKASFLHVAMDQVVLEGSFQINDRIKEEGDGVHLSTIHASKGLEYDRVYIAGANTGIIPLEQHKKGSGNLKEEKRLLFVAITRAKNKVEIGWHAQSSFRNALPEPSYFLNAIPDNLLIRKTATSLSEEKPKEKAANEWSINMPIVHKKYGNGVIVKMDEKEITCTFHTFGEKSFSRAFAKALLLKVE